MRALLLCVLLPGCFGVPMPVEPKADAGTCEVGASRPCRCANLAGTQTCIAPNAWSGCGCADPAGSDVAVPPAPPPPQRCGANLCPKYLEEDTEVGTKGCCTTDGKCGSKSDFLFGGQCVVRGASAGTKSASCPDEAVNFVDVDGCCRADGKCGLSVDAVPNFDLGCIERTQMAKLLNDAAGSRNTLSAVFFLPNPPASFAATTCTP